MRFPCITLIGLLAWATVAAAQPHATVLPDRILTGHGNAEFIPRFATYLPKSLTVPARNVVPLAGEASFEAIEIAGTVRCTGPVTLTVTHLTVLPGGTFDCPQDAVIVFRNVPIDTVKDPYQFGNGLINMGTLRLRGPRTVATMTTLTTDADAGATSLSLEVPRSWRVGDELLLPDTRQIGEATPIRREAPVFIAEIGAGTISLSKPLDFAHASIADPDGVVKARPPIANLTRALTVKSENPQGTRGHVIMLGHAATWDVQGVGFFDLGRTKAINLDSTTATADGTVTHVGTNQVGRYAFHVHHSQGLRTVFRDNVLLDSGLTKWGHATHGSHDSLIEYNIAVGFIGAGFVTEDSYEVRNVYRRNIAAYHAGNGMNAVGNIDPPRTNVPGGEGAGFWFRGQQQIIDHNEAWNNSIGFNLFNMNHVAGMFPSTPGGPLDSRIDRNRSMPISLTGNRGLSNSKAGFETWNTPVNLPTRDLFVANNRHQVIVGGGIAGNFQVTGLLAYAQGGVGYCLSSAAAYHGYLVVNGGELRGCATGVRDTLLEVTLRHVILQNRVNIAFTDFPAHTIFDHVLHKPFGTDPPKYFVPPTRRTRFESQFNTGTRVRVTNWQGTGQDFLLFPTSSSRTAPALVANLATGAMACPEALTNGQCWDKYGIGLYGGVVDPAAAVPLEGVVNGVALPGSSYPLGVPRAVMTLPNMTAPARVQADGPHVRLYFLLTGNPVGATTAAMVQVDTEKVARRVADGAGFADYPTRLGVTPGTHRVRTWRESSPGVTVPGSEMTFTYFVEAPTGHPPPQTATR